MASMPTMEVRAGVTTCLTNGFRCLPNYGNDLRYQYNLQLYLIAKSDLLSYLLSQLLKQPVSIGKLDPTMANDILNTEYALS